MKSSEIEKKEYSLYLDKFEDAVKDHNREIQEAKTMWDRYNKQGFTDLGDIMYQKKVEKSAEELNNRVKFAWKIYCERTGGN